MTYPKPPKDRVKRTPSLLAMEPEKKATTAKVE